MTSSFLLAKVVSLLLVFWFDGRSWKNFRIFALDLPELRRSNEADVPSRSFCDQYPGDLFHVQLACDAFVIVSRAVCDRKSNGPIGVQPRAENFCLRRAVALDYVRPTARSAQSARSLRSSIFHFDRDHDCFASKKRSALRNGSLCNHTQRARFTQISKKFARSAAHFTANWE